ncbi:MAG: IS30 family transposase [Myxococcota bacterium]
MNAPTAPCFVQARGSIRKELASHLRQRKSARRPAASSKKRPMGGAIQDGVSILERPPEVEDRAALVHWEGDSVCGKKGTQVATLVERNTRFVMLVKIDSPDGVTTANALIEAIKNLPDALKDSLTWDRGSEMAGHERIAFESKMDIYFVRLVALGNEAAMRTPTACSGGTSPKEPISPNLRRKR